uniref:PDZ domain-containing protein n=1 Tax=Rhabditophanes sp. KR3021 TaxID=114890 RepID=A0AC35TX18_9BILA
MLSLVNFDEEAWRNEDVEGQLIPFPSTTIKGGIDQPQEGGDSHIVVTQISQGGAVATDGRLREGDILIKINNVDTTRVSHETAVNALRDSGNVVKLSFKRRKGLFANDFSSLGRYNTTTRSSLGQGVQPTPSTYVPSHQPPSVPSHTSLTNNPITRRLSEVDRIMRMPGVRQLTLNKGGAGLGFSIAGGVQNEHHPGDDGIYITKIIEGGAAYYDQRLQVGDLILCVDETPLEHVSHEYAVQTLKATSNIVRLLYISDPHPEFTRNLVALEDSTNRLMEGNSLRNSTSAQNLSGSQSHLMGGDNYRYGTVPASDVPTGDRQVTLLKKSQGLGFNIVGGENGEPIFISAVAPGGVADLSNNVKPGDLLLGVNGMSLRGADHQEAARCLKEAQSPVTLTLSYKPFEYENFKKQIENLRIDLAKNVGTMSQDGAFRPSSGHFYVKALFDHDAKEPGPNSMRNLAFKHGDILHVKNSSDDEYWSASLVGPSGEEYDEGLIPSKKRVERKERQRRKQVNFSQGSGSLTRSHGSQGHLDNRRGSRTQLSFSRKFPFVKSTERLHELAELEVSSNEDPVFSYKRVESVPIDYVRPVIILGAMKERITDALVVQNPDRFASCVPHTSRPPRDNEVNGRDYYFVSKQQMDEDIKNKQFIEAGQFQNNLYGTSIYSVKQVAASGKHCILDVSGNAVQRLQETAHIYPVVLFIRPRHWKQIAAWGQDIPDEEAQSMYERAIKVESKFGDLFTTVISAETPEEVMARVYSAIDENARSQIWIPSQ